MKYILSIFTFICLLSNTSAQCVEILDYDISINSPCDIEVEVFYSCSSFEVEVFATGQQGNGTTQSCDILGLASFEAFDMDCTGDVTINIIGYDFTSNVCGSDSKTVPINPFLPVELKYLTLSEYPDRIVVEWVTLSELNNEYFQLEHSTDGKGWDSIHRVTGESSSTRERRYSTYQLLSKLPPGDNYFRLKQVDEDGNNRYIGDVLHYLNNQSLFFVKNGILTSPVDGELLSIVGRNVGHLNKGQNDIYHLPSGIYIVVTNKKSYKIIKN